MPAAQEQPHPIFLPEIPRDLKRSGFRARISKNDTAVINTYVVYAENSRSKTQEPAFVAANPFGLKNMSGNVAEFCSDWYQPDAYSKYPGDTGDQSQRTCIRTPKGLSRGGSYKDAAGR